MFDDLDRTLANLLKRNLPVEVSEAVDISFDTPDSKFPPSWVKLPSINLFLYDAREDLELRSTDWGWKQKGNNICAVTRPPTQLQCSYIITGWTSESSPNYILEEHRLLGAAMKALLRDKIISKDNNEGDLKEGNARIQRTLALQADYLRMGEFWQAMGGKPRMAINFQVTISIDVRPPNEVEEVRERKFKLYDANRPENVMEEFELKPANGNTSS